MPEIDETELANLRKMADIATRVSNHPEGRKLLQEAVAVAIPEEAGPEIRIRKEMDEKFNSLQKTMQEFIEAQTKQREEAAAESAKTRLANQWAEGRKWAGDAGYTKEGLEKLEEFMEREGIASHKHAAKAFDAENPAPPPPITANHGFGWKDQNSEDVNAAAVKALWDGDEDSFLNTMIPQAIAEVRGR